MARADDLVRVALRGLPAKPPGTSPQGAKKRYSEQMSAALALAFAEELRQRGMIGSVPALPGSAAGSGAERRMAGGIGAKKVDVSWATQESGLLAAVSIKTINWRDANSGAFQKNLTNRRTDLLQEAVTLHRRFPYAVLFGMLWLDAAARHDGTARRRSTFENAHPRMRLFTGRDDPSGRDEQYEALYIALVEATPFAATWEVYEAGNPTNAVTMDEVFNRLVEIVVERNVDFYEVVPPGALRRVT